MEKLARLLNKKKQMKILDVGTGTGNFVNLITTCYKDYQEIVGIDTTLSVLESAKENFDDKRITFKQMDALNMSFEDHTFDVVCLSNSLHHLKNISAIFYEMERVLKEDGIIIIAEMISNDLNSKQLSHLKLHHFAAKIDRMRGVIHNDTFSEKEILEILDNHSNFSIQNSWKLKVLRGNQELPDRFVWFEETIQRLLNGVPDKSKLSELQQESEVIVDYIKEHGFDTCPTQIVVMGK